MKIGIIPTTTQTGERRYNDYLIKGLEERCIDFEVLNHKILKSSNIRVFLGSFMLKRILKKKNLSILHNIDNLGPFVVRSDKNTKNILTVHDIAPVLFPHLHGYITRLDFEVILPRLIKNSDSIITVSYSTKDDLMSKFGIEEKKLNVIHLGVDNSFFTPKLPQKDILAKYGINKEYLLFVGNANPRKNLNNLILAFSKIFDEIPHDLVLIGPINRENLIKFILDDDKFDGIRERFLERIITPGYADYEDLPFLYSGASSFVFPSFYEGFGLPPLEAMACGTPVISSNNSSLKEVVGKAGILIDDPFNLNEISEKILYMLENSKLQKKLKNKGLTQVEKFSWDKTVEKTIDVYESMSDK